LKWTMLWVVKDFERDVVRQGRKKDSEKKGGGLAQVSPAEKRNKKTFRDHVKKHSGFRERAWAETGRN